jgi:integrase
MDSESGKSRQLSRTVRFDKKTGTKGAAKEALRNFRDEIKAGAHAGATVTFGKLLTAWLEKVEDLGRARTTIETYKTHVSKHIRPALGSVRLSQLDKSKLDEYFRTLRAKGLSASTVKLNHAILSACLAYGVEYNWIAANPASGIRLREPDAIASGGNALTLDQLRLLYFGTEKKGKHVQGALEEDPDLAVTIALAAITGCRRGELIGLRWDDVDWERQCVVVERAWVPVAGGQHLTTPKTKKARTVFLGDAGIAILKQYRADKEELLGQVPEGWLLSYDGGATPMRAKSLTQYVTKLGKRVGVPVHFHQLRHFAATELNAAGVDLPTAAAQLGHSPAVMAGTYLHTSDDRAARAGQVIASVVGTALEAAAEVSSQ